MKELPVSLRTRPLRALLDAGRARIRRPADGMYKDLQLGDRLWLREAYHLEKRHDHSSPSGASAAGAKPVFAVDQRDLPSPPEGLLGPSRAAYTLLREWSRFYLIVEGVEAQPLDNITLAEAKAEGFSSLDAFFAEWDSLVSAVSGRNPTRSAGANPTVLVIDARLVRHPLDARWREPA